MPRGIYDRKKAKPRGKRKFGSVALREAPRVAVTSVITRDTQPKVVSVAKYTDVKLKAVRALQVGAARIRAIILDQGAGVKETGEMALGYTADQLDREAREISQL
jgi:hypothetical protein